MRNYEFDINEENQAIILHMMDKVEKYINKICMPNSGEVPMVQIQGPENMPHEILSMIESTLQNRFVSNFKPKPDLDGIISVRIHDPYTLVFEVSKLWFEQKLEDVQVQIIEMLDIAEDYVDIDWARHQFEDKPEDPS